MRQDAAEMLVKRFGQDAEGVCGVPWKGGDSHCFSWKIKEGVVSFFDNQQRNGNVDRYFNLIDPNGSLTLARLDGLEIDMEAVSKYVQAR